MTSSWYKPGLIATGDGSVFKALVSEPLACGQFEQSFEGSVSNSFFQKLGDLLTRLPNAFDGQILICRRRQAGDEAFLTRILFFERIQKDESYSHLDAVAKEMGMSPHPLLESDWHQLIAGFLGATQPNSLPDLIWNGDHISTGPNVIRTLSLTELPQMTWKGCLQPILEYPAEFTFSLKFTIPDRKKVRRQLETKRRVSHALSITSSLEVKNIESNSVLHSSEETLERILVNKETLFEISVAVILTGTDRVTLDLAQNLERSISGVANAGLYAETVGTLPVLASHIPGSKMLGIRKLPILSENFAQIFPILLDYSRSNDESSLHLRSRCGEVSHLNLFSKENLNFNSFICGASGSGKSFLMNAILTSALKDDPKTRLCIFDVGGSYRKIVEANGGRSSILTGDQARSLTSTYLNLQPVTPEGFFRTFLETLCGSGAHITHSHRVAIDDLLKQVEGEKLSISKLIQISTQRPERFYQEVGHWLKPHVSFDSLRSKANLDGLLKSQVSAFDFKELDSDPVLQRTTILLLSEILWQDLVNGTYSRTLIVFDEVWRFFAESKTFLEEMYRTLRKYKAGIVSITQNLADYGDEAFAKMIFTNSFTKIFLQNGAAAEFLRDTFDLPATDIERALSVVSKKPEYSEFFSLTPVMSQVFRLYPTAEFYRLANTENISQAKEV